MRSQYSLGFSSTNPEKDGSYRKIKIKTNRKGLKVQARRGYYAPLPDGSTTVAEELESEDPEFQGALDSPYEIDGINLRMTHFVRDETLMGTAHVYVAGEIDIGGLEFTEEEGLDVARLEFEPSEMDRAFQYRKALIKRVQDQDWLYVTLDLAGYSQGSLNRPLGKKKR